MCRCYSPSWRNGPTANRHNLRNTRQNKPANWLGFALKWVDTSYDALDRKTREAASGGGVTASVTEFNYDLAGRLRCTAVRMNPDVWAAPLPDKCVPGPAHAAHGADRISRNVYDSAGRLTESWDGVGTPLQRREAAYTYNANGQKLTLTDARGHLAEMRYDGFGRQQRWIFPSKTSPGVADQADHEQYQYDVDGNRTKLRKRDGSELTFQYDALNRMIVKIVPDRLGLTSAQTRDVYYDYDLRGLQTKARFDSLAGEGVTTAYDGFGRVISSTLAMAGTNRAIGHLYDGEGNRVRITHPDGSFFTYEYDGLNRFVRVRENGGDPLAIALYDNAGRRARSGWAAATDYSYDPAGRLESLSHDLAGTSADQVIGLGYNPASQIRTRTGTNDSYAWTGSVATNRPYAVNGLNQYSSAGASTFGYDPNGNLVTATSPPYTTNYVYDVENRLVSASGAQSANLVYDPLGRLFQTSGWASGATQFLYDDNALIAEYNSAGTMVHRYIHGPAKGVDDPLIWYNNPASGWRQALVADQQGSIIAVADMNGNPIAINAYDEYGIPKFGNVGRFQYTGQAWIPELGMYYYKARFYSPTLGRFLQVDPIGYNDQVNLYAYVRNNPTNMRDPTGASGVLTIYANNYHAWIGYAQDGRKAPATWGRFAKGHGAGPSGVQINTERNRNYPWVVRRQVRINDAGEDRLFNYLREQMMDSSWEFWNNCVDFSQGGWTAVTGETFSDPWGPQRPGGLIGELRSLNKQAPNTKGLSSLPEVAAEKGYDSVRVNKDGSVTGTYTTTGTRIRHKVTCNERGCE